MEFFKKSDWSSSHILILNDTTLSIVHNYSSLRNHFTPTQIALYYSDKKAFAAQSLDGSDILGYVDAEIGKQTLLCCSLLKDHRIFAVASEEGFVFLIDTRDYKLFRSIDVGGGLGKSLCWMCADPNSNAFVTLLRDGTMVHYQGVEPPH